LGLKEGAPAEIGQIAVAWCHGSRAGLGAARGAQACHSTYAEPRVGRLVRWLVESVSVGSLRNGVRPGALHQRGTMQ
jgi:hypothetical protein